MQSAEEVVAWACAVFQGLLSGLYLRLKSLYCTSFEELGSFACVKCYVSHFLFMIDGCFFLLCVGSVWGYLKESVSSFISICGFMRS